MKYMISLLPAFVKDRRQKTPALVKAGGNEGDICYLKPLSYLLALHASWQSLNSPRSAFRSCSQRPLWVAN